MSHPDKRVQVGRMGYVPAYGGNGNSRHITSCSKPSLHCRKRPWEGALYKWLTRSASDAVQQKIRIQGYPMNCTCHWRKLKIIVDPAQNLVTLLKLQLQLKKVSFSRRPSGFDDLGNFYTTIGIYLGCHNAAISQAECGDSPYQKL